MTQRTMTPEEHAAEQAILQAVAKTLYNHWRRNSHTVSPWEEAADTLKTVFLQQAQSLRTAKLLISPTSR